MFLHAVDPLDDEVPRIHDPQHRPPLSLVLADGDDDVVAFPDFFHSPGHQPFAGDHSTSGASETIFMKRSLRSSRVTGPKMRVPIGSRSEERRVGKECRARGPAGHTEKESR